MKEITLNVTKKGIHFDQPIPQINRNKDFEVVVGTWDEEAGIQKVKLSNFRSLVFDHISDSFVKGSDANPNIVIEIETNRRVPRKCKFKSGAGALNFPFHNDAAKVRPDKHRLIEYDMEIETEHGDLAIVDSPWDERP